MPAVPVSNLEKKNGNSIQIGMMKKQMKIKNPELIQSLLKNPARQDFPEHLMMKQKGTAADLKKPRLLMWILSSRKRFPEEFRFLWKM